MFWLLALSVFFSHVVAAPNAQTSQRIVGGEVTTIERYPFQAALLRVSGNTVDLICGGSILNPRSILTAAGCFWDVPNPQRYRIRVGSTFAYSGGVVHSSSQIIIHPNYNREDPYDYDIAILRSSTVINFNNVIQPASIAGTNYNLLDNEPVWATGWGFTYDPPSEQLRHVQIWTINQATCRSLLASVTNVTDNMLCAGIPDVGGAGQCSYDWGGPLHTHDGVVVGITSRIIATCGDRLHPSVNMRVSRFTTWIQANA